MIKQFELSEDLIAYVDSHPVDGFDLEICEYIEGDWEPIAPEKRMIGYTLWEAVCDVLNRNGYDYEQAQALATQGGIEEAYTD